MGTIFLVKLMVYVCMYVYMYYVCKPFDKIGLMGFRANKAGTKPNRRAYPFPFSPEYRLMECNLVVETEFQVSKSTSKILSSPK